MSEGPLILLVDDDRDFLDINTHVLERAGYRVLPAHSPGEALTLLEGAAPDAIVTDLMMDSLDAGFAFCRRVKGDARLAGVPILMATSAASHAGLDFGPRGPGDLAAMNIDAFLDKPVSPRDLVEKVKAILNRR